MMTTDDVTNLVIQLVYILQNKNHSFEVVKMKKSTSLVICINLWNSQVHRLRTWETCLKPEETPTQVFSCEFAKYLRTPSSKNIYERLLLEYLIFGSGFASRYAVICFIKAYSISYCCFFMQLTFLTFFKCKKVTSTLFTRLILIPIFLRNSNIVVVVKVSLFSEKFSASASFRTFWYYNKLYAMKCFRLQQASKYAQ